MDVLTFIKLTDKEAGARKVERQVQKKESANKLEGAEGEELQTFSGVRHLNTVGATWVSFAQPKVR